MSNTRRTLTVSVEPSIYGVDYKWFFDQMVAEIEKNIKVPEYVKIVDSHKIINKIVLMTSMQEYFYYTMGFLCGIPGVVMEGSKDDWK